LECYRPRLVSDRDPGTLFVDRRGGAFKASDVTTLISKLTAVHGGVRVKPHLFRDIVAFAWLKKHPNDYLTLSKILWHKNIDTTIRIYGGRFNESSGVCGMEKWLDSRETNGN